MESRLNRNVRNWDSAEIRRYLTAPDLGLSVSCRKPPAVFSPFADSLREFEESR